MERTIESNRGEQRVSRFHLLSHCTKQRGVRTYFGSGVCEVCVVVVQLCVRVPSNLVRVQGGAKDDEDEEKRTEIPFLPSLCPSPFLLPVLIVLDGLAEHAENHGCLFNLASQTELACPEAFALARSFFAILVVFDTTVRQ